MQTREDFMKMIREFTEEELIRYQDGKEEERKYRDPSELAEMLVRDGLVTMEIMNRIDYD